MEEKIQDYKNKYHKVLWLEIAHRFIQALHVNSYPIHPVTDFTITSILSVIPAPTLAVIAPSIDSPDQYISIVLKVHKWTSYERED